jgi:hypothetical protein
MTVFAKYAAQKRNAGNHWGHCLGFLYQLPEAGEGDGSVSAHLHCQRVGDRTAPAGFPTADELVEWRGLRVAGFLGFAPVESQALRGYHPRHRLHRAVAAMWKTPAKSTSWSPPKASKRL